MTKGFGDVSRHSAEPEPVSRLGPSGECQGYEVEMARALAMCAAWDRAAAALLSRDYAACDSALRAFHQIKEDRRDER